jgi:hypothetical protein
MGWGLLKDISLKLCFVTFLFETFCMFAFYHGLLRCWIKIGIFCPAALKNLGNRLRLIQSKPENLIFGNGKVSQFQDKFTKSAGADRLNNLNDQADGSDDETRIFLKRLPRFFKSQAETLQLGGMCEKFGFRCLVNVALLPAECGCPTTKSTPNALRVQSRAAALDAPNHAASLCRLCC